MGLTLFKQHLTPAGIDDLPSEGDEAPFQLSSYINLEHLTSLALS